MRSWLLLTALLIPISCGRQLGALEPTSPEPAAAQPATKSAVSAPVSVSPSGAAPAADLVLVASCVTSAIEHLGWLATTSHQGAFLRTAIQRSDLPEECAALASDEHAWSFPAPSGGTVGWVAGEPRALDSRAEVELVFECRSGCSERTTTKVTLPWRWHCFGWVHGRDHGTSCGPSHAACEAKRAHFERGARPTTPCELQVGAAYCDRDDPKKCFPTPWDCEREVPGGGGRSGRCVKTD